ncbi:MAG TPA: FGGY family carbohydrate kinase, partial [Ktedonobacterales bacterium]
MADSTYFLGIDISTTGVKALLVDAQGQVIAAATQPHTSSAPQPLWSEQRPQDWADGAVTAIGAVLRVASLTGEQVAAVGLTGQMHGMVALDAQ